MKSEDGEMLFVKPWEEEQEFGEFMDFVIEQEKSGKVDGEVRYAQTRSLNLLLYFSLQCIIICKTLYYPYSKHYTFPRSFHSCSPE